MELTDSFQISEVIADHYGPKTAESYDTISYDLFWTYRESLEALATDLVWSRENFSQRNSLKILDVGAGTGNLASTVVHELSQRAELEQREMQISVTLYDSSPYMMAQAPNKLSALKNVEVQLCVGRLENPTWQDSYDLIISSFALHHLDGPGKAKALSNMAHSLRPGGVLGLLDRIWLDHKYCGVSEDQFLRVAAKKFYLLAKRKNPALNLNDVVGELRREFLRDGDQPSGIVDHVSWLRQAGLTNIMNSFASFGIAGLTAERPLNLTN